MRKLLIGGSAVVVLAAAAAFGGKQYLQSRVLAEVEQSFAAIRAGGATAAHGPVDIDLWGRKLSIADIIVRSAGEGSTDITVSKMAVDGIDLFATDLAAGQVELTNVEAKTSFGTNRELNTTYKVPQLVATNVRSGNPSADLPDPTDPVLKSLASFAAMSATTISAPTVTVATTMPAMPQQVPGRPPIAGGRPIPIEYVYSNVKIADVRDGRIAHVTFDGGTMKTGPGSPIGDATFLATTMDDIDVLPVFGMGLASRQAKNGYYQVIGKTAVAGYSFKIADGGEIKIGPFTSAAQGIDPAKLSYAKWKTIFASMTSLGPNPTPAQMASFGTTMADLYDGMQLSGAEVRDIKISGPPNGPQFNMDIGSMTMGPLEKGKLAEFRVSNVSGLMKTGGAPAVPVKLGTFALKGFDIATLMRAAMTLPASGQPPTPDKLIGLLATLEGFELEGLVAPDPKTGQMIRIDAANLSWGQFINNLPSRLKWKVKFLAPVNPADSNTAALQQLGIRMMAFENETSLNWVESERKLAANVSASMGQLGAISTNLALGNVPRSTFSINPGQLAAIAPGFEIGPMDLTIKDGGAVQIFRTIFAAQQPAPSDPNAPKPDPVAPLKAMLVDPAQPDSNIGRLLDHVSRFLATPGQTLSLKLVPKNRISVAQLTAPDALAAPGAPAALLELFTVDVNLSR